MNIDNWNKLADEMDRALKSLTIKDWEEMYPKKNWWERVVERFGKFLSEHKGA